MITNSGEITGIESTCSRSGHEELLANSCELVYICGCVLNIEGSRPEWCISSMIYSRDTPFWLETGLLALLASYSIMLAITAPSRDRLQFPVVPSLHPEMVAPVLDHRSVVQA